MSGFGPFPDSGGMTKYLPSHRTFPTARLLATLLAGGLLASACGVDAAPTATEGPSTTVPAATVPVEPTPTLAPTTTSTTTTTTTTLPPTLDPAIQAILDTSSTWSSPTRHSVDDRALSEDNWTEVADDGVRQRVECAPESLGTVSRTFDSFPAFAFSGPVVPGVIVEGAGLEDADLRVLPLDRAPLTLISDLAQANPTHRVEDPTTSQLAEAVAILRRDGDDRINGGPDLVPARLDYTMEATHSFAESRLQLGVSARYSSRLAQASFESSFEQREQREQHSVAMRLTQPMYTLSVELDSIVQSGDYFDPTLDPAVVNTQVAARTLGADNPPVLVDSVTYGRVVYVVMTSSSVESDSELEATINGARGKWEAGAELSASERQVLESSQLTVFAQGGEANVAETAIRSGNLADFFGTADVTNAVPLSFTGRTLGGQRVTIDDTADLKQLACGSNPEPYGLTIVLSNVHGAVEVRIGGELMASAEHTPNDLLTWGNEYKRGSANEFIAADQLVPGDNLIHINWGKFGCVKPYFTVVLTSQRSGQEAKVAQSGNKTKCGDLDYWYNFNSDTGEITVTTEPIG